jgi:hypothetical protein
MFVYFGCQDSGTHLSQLLLIDPLSITAGNSASSREIVPQSHVGLWRSAPRKSQALIFLLRKARKNWCYFLLPPSIANLNLASPSSTTRHLVTVPAREG